LSYLRVIIEQMWPRNPTNPTSGSDLDQRISCPHADRCETLSLRLMCLRCLTTRNTKVDKLPLEGELALVGLKPDKPTRTRTYPCPAPLIMKQKKVRPNSLTLTIGRSESGRFRCGPLRLPTAFWRRYRGITPRGTKACEADLCQESTKIDPRTTSSRSTCVPMKLGR
jgi:hypothetical protein